MISINNKSLNIVKIWKNRHTMKLLFKIKTNRQIERERERDMVNYMEVTKNEW
jgi:hypothetical protein